MSQHSDDYHDYVFKDGNLLGRFDDMYRYSKEVPWHQDKTAFAIFSGIDLAILRYFYQTAKWKKILDVGCGLGHLTARLQGEFPEAEVHGLDISPTAIEQASDLHGGIHFFTADLRQPLTDNLGAYDLVFAKNLLWYVLPELDVVMSNIKALSGCNGWFFLSQSLPNLEDYYGKKKFPDPDSIIDYCSAHFAVRYGSSTFERGTHKVVPAYDVDRHARFLGQNVNR